MDEIHAQEQAHLSEIYAMLVKIRTDLETTLNTTQKDAARDLRQMSEEIRPNFGGADETIETLAAIETLNSVIDTYNQYHDFTVEKLGRVEMLLRQPYFAKVRLKMTRPSFSRRVYRRCRHYRRRQKSLDCGLEKPCRRNVLQPRNGSDLLRSRR